jgi:hypothetical protein
LRDYSAPARLHDIELQSNRISQVPMSIGDLMSRRINHGEFYFHPPQTLL